MMKQTLLFMALLCPFLLAAQIESQDPYDQIPEKNQLSDSSRLHIGFHLGYTNTTLYNQPQPGSTAAQPGSGIRLGLYSAYDLSDYLAISPKVELAMNSGRVAYYDGDGVRHTSPAVSSTLQLMGHIVFKLPKGKNQPFLSIGPNLRVPVKQESLAEGNYGYQSDVALDLGLGFERAFKPFSIIPEIRYSYGFKDVNLNPWSGPLYVHQLSLIIAFVD